MALDSYTGLIEALTVWMDGTPFSGQEATFVALTEADLNARLAIGLDQGRMIRPLMVKNDITIAAEYVDMPDGRTILPLTIEVTGLERAWQIKYIDPDTAVRLRYGQDEVRLEVEAAINAQPPRYYTMVGDQVRFFPAPQSSFTAVLTRYAKVAPLTLASSSNWVLASHPNVYLYGCLAQAEMLGWNDSRMANFATLYANAVDGVIASYPTPVSQPRLPSGLAGLGWRSGAGAGAVADNILTDGDYLVDG